MEYCECEKDTFPFVSKGKIICSCCHRPVTEQLISHKLAYAFGSCGFTSKKQVDDFRSQIIT